MVLIALPPLRCSAVQMLLLDFRCGRRWRDQLGMTAPGSGLGVRDAIEATCQRLR